MDDGSLVVQCPRRIFLAGGRVDPGLSQELGEGVSQEEGSTPVQKTFDLMLRREGLPMVCAQPVFMAITCPGFQNQILLKGSLALLFVIQQREARAIGQCDVESRSHSLLPP